MLSTETSREWNPILTGLITPKRKRIALYSHDTMGLGHTRRNLLIAQTLVKRFDNLDLLLITGAKEATHFPRQPGIDFLTLPSLHKDASGRYSARELELSLEELSELRAEAIWAALKVFKPDLFIVDNVPRGANQELKQPLKKLRRKTQARIVLGLRDILDEPEIVRQQWQLQNNESVIEKYFDAIWVYGDPRVLEPAKEYGFSKSVAGKIRQLGYLDGRARLNTTQAITEAPLVLCQVGGGQDGTELAETFAKTPLPNGWQGILIMGPFMPLASQERLHQLAAARNNLKVLEFVAEPLELLQRASRVISMGGYNTVVETLACEKPLLIVPRVKPRLEQLIRAERLHQLGLLDYLHPEALSPQSLAGWLAKDVDASGIRERLDFGALDKLCLEVSRLLNHPSYVPEAEFVGSGSRV